MEFLMKLVGWTYVLILCAACANQVAPTGGPRDEAPPEVIRTTPEHESLNYKGQEVEILFDEFVRPATYGKEIFISPLPPSRPKIILLNKKLRIKFNEKLKDSTTYVITLTEVADQNEGNKMEESFSLAFSTGNILDSMKVEGKVLGKYLGEPATEITVMLFEADSVEDNDFFKKRPAYISKTNDRGEFSFQNLRNTRFYIYGVTDADQSNTYSQPNEAIAISKDPNVYFVDTNSTATDTLYSFLPDDDPPIMLGYNWVNDSTIIARFNEGILPDALLMTMADTLGNDPKGISSYTYLGGRENELMIAVPRRRDGYSDINFLNVRDSLGHAMDSLMRIIPERTRTLENEYLKKPTYNDLTDQFEMIFPTIFEEGDTLNIYLTDTFQTVIDTTGMDSLQIDSAKSARPVVPKISLEIDDFLTKIVPEKRPEPDVPFFLKVEGKRLGNTDTVYSYMIKWPDPENFGTLEGVLKMPNTYEGKIVMHFGKDKNPPVRIVYDTTYSFTRLKADKYKVEVILDTDSNRVWTPGSLNPYRTPERIYKHTGEISIRANWEFEDYEIVVDLAKAQQGPPPEEEETDTSAVAPNGGSPPNQRGRGNKNRN